MLSFNLFMFRSLANLTELPPPEGLYYRDIPSLREYDRSAHQRDIDFIVDRLHEKKRTQKNLKIMKEGKYARIDASNDEQLMSGTFRYFPNPDECLLPIITTEIDEKPLTPLLQQVNEDALDKGLNQNILDLMEYCAESDTVNVDSEILKAILQRLQICQEDNQRLQHKLTECKSMDGPQQGKTMQERCEQLERELHIASRNRVHCPICLDGAEEIARSKRTLQTTLCGHIFCDECLNRSVLHQSKKGDTKKKRITCPRCRKTLTTFGPTKYAHSVFV